MKLSLYFIFYVVMILELLIFIMERDEATDKHSADVAEMLMLSDNLAREFQKPLDISVPENSTATIYGSSLQRALHRTGDSVHVLLSPLGLWSAAERGASRSRSTIPPEPKWRMSEDPAPSLSP